MRTSAQRVFLITNSGLYRSDDGGGTWRQMAADDVRIRNGQGGYNCGVYVDPSNPDVVYTISTSSYKSTDGGKTFTGFKGAPGGDDPQQLWIDPTNGSRMLLGLDQGARRHARWWRRRGARTTTSRPTRSITWRSTTPIRTGCTAPNRTPAPSARASAATSAPSHHWIGIRCRAGSGARCCPTRSTRTRCTRAARAS